MPQSNLHKINFNLLVVMRALLKTQSVSDTAELIGRTPSTVSAALGQLRDIFDDPLFIRDGRGLKPTARALQLIVPVEQAIHQISLVFEQVEFDPLHSERSLTIAAPDILIAFDGPKILESLSRRAPGMSLKFEGLEFDLVDKMRTRLVDFALVPEMAIGRLAPLQLSYLPVNAFDIDTVVMRDGHPLSSKKKINHLDLKEHTHISYRPNDPFTDHIQSHPAMNFDSKVIVNQSLAIPSFVERSDLIALGTASQYSGLNKRAGLTTIPLSPKIPLPYGIAWSSVFQSDAAHSWLRTLIFETLTEKSE